MATLFGSFSPEEHVQLLGGPLTPSRENPLPNQFHSHAEKVSLPSGDAIRSQEGPAVQGQAEPGARDLHANAAFQGNECELPQPAERHACEERERCDEGGEPSEGGRSVEDGNEEPQVSGDELKMEFEGEVESFRARGMANANNRCYANATLQALLATKPLLHLGRKIARAEREGRIPKKYRAVRCFSNLSDEVTREGQGNSEVLSESASEPLLRLFKAGGSWDMRQEDAHEFLSFVLGRLHEELAELEERADESGRDHSMCSNENKEAFGEEEWEEVGPKNRSTITREVGDERLRKSAVRSLFFGKLRSLVKQPGKKASVTLQPFDVLQLDINDDAISDIQSALRNFSNPEALGSASKRMQIGEPPTVLIIQLVRFTILPNGEQKKVDRPVRPRMTLTIPKDACPSTPTYELFASVTHHGETLSSGHYTADIRAAGNKWLRIDDRHVYRISPRDACNDDAYLLFYQMSSSQHSF